MKIKDNVSGDIWTKTLMAPTNYITNHMVNNTSIVSAELDNYLENRVWPYPGWDIRIITSRHIKQE